MTKEERQLNEFTEIVKQLSDEECKKLIKAAKIIQAVPDEQSAQIIPLREAGFSIEQIAERFGVEL